MTKLPASSQPAGRARCPICHKPAQEALAPFCSNRCAHIDLGKWLKGDYSVPVVEHDDLPDDEIPEESAEKSAR